MNRVDTIIPVSGEEKAGPCIHLVTVLQHGTRTGTEYPSYS